MVPLAMSINSAENSLSSSSLSLPLSSKTGSYDNALIVTVCWSLFGHELCCCLLNQLQHCRASVAPASGHTCT